MGFIKERFSCENTDDLVHLAIKYCLSRGKTSCALVGFRNAQQLRTSLSTEGYLTKGERDFIRKTFKGVNEDIGNFIEFKGV